MKAKLKFAIDPPRFGHRLKFYAFIQRADGGVDIAMPPAFSRVELGNCAEEPTFEMENEAAQELANALYEAGFRAAGAAGSAGQLSATEKHLDDMRKIAFQLLNEGEKVEIRSV